MGSEAASQKTVYSLHLHNTQKTQVVNSELCDTQMDVYLFCTKHN
jgi:hypothetical protein